MKTLYFVTEGTTGKIVLEGLLADWLDGEDYIARHVQPPESAYADGLDSPLSNGWRGVLSWCAGSRPSGPVGRDFALSAADLLVVHMDADVATDAQFIDPAYAGSCPPARGACNWVRNHLTSLFDSGTLPSNIVLCVPSKDLEAWVLSAIHPDTADLYPPIECRAEPGALLIQRAPHRLVRRKDNSLKKDTTAYRAAVKDIVVGWPNCAHGSLPRCPEAARFESEAKAVLQAT